MLMSELVGSIFDGKSFVLTAGYFKDCLLNVMEFWVLYIKHIHAGGRTPCKVHPDGYHHLTL